MQPAKHITNLELSRGLHRIKIFSSKNANRQKTFFREIVFFRLWFLTNSLVTCADPVKWSVLNQKPNSRSAPKNHHSSAQ